MDGITSFTNYKEYVNQRIQKQKGGGRGTYTKIAQFLQVSNVLVSQVLKGDRHFTRENAFQITEFFRMESLESEYFMAMYEHNTTRLSNHQSFLDKVLVRLRQQITEHEISKQKEIAEGFSRIYYSSWLYPATRLSFLNPQINTVADASRFLGQTPDILKPIVDFLIEADLLEEKSDGVFRVTSKNVHLDRKSDYAMKHHMNLKNLEIRRIVDGLDESDLCYSSMYITSREQIEALRDQLRKMIKDVNQELVTGDSQELVLFNLSLVGLDQTQTPA